VEQRRTAGTTYPPFDNIEEEQIMSVTMAWLALLAAGLLDVAWAVSMKYAEGYTRLGWTLLSLALLAAFVFLLGRCLTVLPVGTAYAVWTGIGAAGTVLMGVLLFGETLEPLRLGGVALVVTGIVALKMA
jgi:quaternary ammonium compound-resistance protein SugE